MSEEVNYIIRVLGKDLDGTVSVESALRGIKGINHRVGKIIATEFFKEKKYPIGKKMGELTPSDIAYLEEIITHPEKHGLPEWALNRQKDFETGESKHKIMNDLDFSVRTDIQRLADIKSYRGLRLSWGLTVRGQRTKSTHRGKGTVVGVMKKDAGPGKGAKPVAGADKGKGGDKKK